MNCENLFLSQFDADELKVRLKLLTCIIKGHKGCYNTDNTISPPEESFHCYRCKATWIKNDKRERIIFYVK